MPIVMDTNPYKVSLAYGLTNVPTVFLVLDDGTVEQTMVGFVKKEYEQLAAATAKVAQKPPAKIFEGVSVPDFKPG